MYFYFGLKCLLETVRPAGEAPAVGRIQTLFVNVMIPKVLAYIVRNNGNDKEVLVFNRSNEPDAFPGVPGGSIENREDIIDALRMEIEEETGL